GEVDKASHLASVAKRTGGHENRIGQFQAAQLDREIDGIGSHGKPASGGSDSRQHSAAHRGGTITSMYRPPRRGATCRWSCERSPCVMCSNPGLSTLNQPAMRAIGRQMARLIEKPDALP